MADLVRRQTVAIEALALRLETAERRLEMMTTLALRTSPADDQPPHTPLAQAPAGAGDVYSDPFRAALSVDWSRVIAGTPDRRLPF